MEENKLSLYDTIGMKFANYCYKNNKTPTISHSFCPALTTNCHVYVVVKE